MCKVDWKLALAGLFVACAFGAVALRIAGATPPSWGPCSWMRFTPSARPLSTPHRPGLPDASLATAGEVTAPTSSVAPQHCQLCSAASQIAHKEAKSGRERSIVRDPHSLPLTLHVARHTYLVADRIERSNGGRAVAAANLQRTAKAGCGQTGSGKARSDAPGNGAGA